MVAGVVAEPDATDLEASEEYTPAGAVTVAPDTSKSAEVRAGPDRIFAMAVGKSSATICEDPPVFARIASAISLNRPVKVLWFWDINSYLQSLRISPDILRRKK